MKKRASSIFLISCCTVIMTLAIATAAWAISDAYKENIYNPGALKPIDSKLKVKV